MVDDDDIDSAWPTELPPPQRAPAPTVAPPTVAIPPQAEPSPAPAAAKSPMKLDSASSYIAPSPRSRARTLTDEGETEAARQRSLSTDGPPPSLSQASLSRASLLSFADDADGEGGGALGLVAQAGESATPMAPSAPSAASAEDTPLREMRERFSLGDYSGALVVAESILEDEPDHGEATRLAENCRGVLQQMYVARLGALDRVPFVAVPREQLRWLSIDHRAGFVLSHVDGISSLEQILDVSGMPPLDALRILYELVQQRVIGIR
ncbi:hypothetical protein BH09MYX1_BH09MYX1_22040 [soil metagenome]